MGSACVKQGSTVVDSTAETTPPAQEESETKSTIPAPPPDPSIDPIEPNNDDPPPPPANCPPWSKLNRKQRYQLTSNDPLMAIESLDDYWYQKIDKYIVKGKLKPLGTHAKGDVAWKHMFTAQNRTQQKRLLIWNEFMKQSFSDLLAAESIADTTAIEQKEQEQEQEKKDSTSTATSTCGVPKGMAAMNANRGPKGIQGMASKNASSLKEKSNISIEKRQVELLKVLNNTIKRIRRISRMLKESILEKPLEEGRQMIYKSNLDHLLVLEEIVQPYRRAKKNLDRTIVNLAKIQILGHEQQMKQWLLAEEREQCMWVLFLLLLYFSIF